MTHRKSLLINKLFESLQIMKNGKLNEHLMISGFNEFNKLYKNNLIEMTNNIFDRTIYGFSYYLITEGSRYIQEINGSINKSKNVIIDQYKDKDNNYLIFTFDKKLIIISVKDLYFINEFFDKNSDSTFIPLSNEIHEDFINNLGLNRYFVFQFLFANENEKEELEVLSKSMQVFNKNIVNFWINIRRSIAANLLTMCYIKTQKNRIENTEFQNNIEVNKKNHIKLRNLGIGSISVVYLIYHIEKEQLFVLKIFLGNDFDDESKELFERERKFYLKIEHPLLSKYYGSTTIDSRDSLIIEYISGTSLESIKKLNLTNKEKVKIIFQILIVIEYIHQKGFIYRDIKPNNFIIDHNKTVVLIDRDRMTEKSDQNICGSITRTLFHIYLAPEIQSSDEFSYESDIYSLGLLIYYIIMEKDPEIKYDSEFNPVVISFDQFPKEFSELKRMCKLCAKIKPSERINLSDLIDSFYIIYFSKMSINISEIDTIQTVKNIHSFKYQNFWVFLSENINPICQYQLGLLFISKELFKLNANKAIKYLVLSADQNYDKAQVSLGLIYEKGKFVKRDIKKAIYYFSLATSTNAYSIYYLAKIYYNKKYQYFNIYTAIHYLKIAALQHDLFDAQYLLGSIYLNGKYIDKNIDKAIYYFTLAACCDDVSSQFQLGLIYCSIIKNYDLAIIYLELAADKDNRDSQYYLAEIYYYGLNGTIDINKAIHYCTRSANNGFLDAQRFLGYIYYYRNVDLSEYYFELAADQNDSFSQLYIGMLNMFVFKNPNAKKALFYLNQSANQNNPHAQFVLGEIFYYGINVERRLSLAFDYIKSAAINHNFSLAQLNLGKAYLEGILLEQNIDMGIHYISLSAEQNNDFSQYFLGTLYLQNKYIPRDINKSLYYLSISARNNNTKALFALAYIYTEGTFVKQNFNKAIRYYNLASLLNDNYSKNNLAVIYKNGYGTHKNIQYAIKLFNEAINQRNDYLSMYNLACLYFFGIDVKEDSKKSIKLLIKSAFNFPISMHVLSLWLVKNKIKITVEEISRLLKNFHCRSNRLAKKLVKTIKSYRLEEKVVYLDDYNFFKKIDYFYDYYGNVFISKYIFVENLENKNRKKPITNDFYKGFGF